MDTIQPWSQMGQGYRAGQSYFQQRPFNRAQPPGQTQVPGQAQIPGQAQNPVMPDITQQMEWLNGLSREERLEAKRLELQANFSFEGFQVVRREFTSHSFDPTMTVRLNSVTFNNSCISKLEDATYIHFMIHPTKQQLVIRSVSEGARDAIRWCIAKDSKRKSRQISCEKFTTKLIAMMNWDPAYYYKIQGIKIKYEGEEMYLFDLKSEEHYLYQHRDPVTGKIPRAKAILPEEWEHSFGMSVEEHAASTEVDLKDGFNDVSLDDDEEDFSAPAQEQIMSESKEPVQFSDQQYSGQQTGN